MSSLDIVRERASRTGVPHFQICSLPRRLRGGIKTVAPGSLYNGLMGVVLYPSNSANLLPAPGPS